MRYFPIIIFIYFTQLSAQQTVIKNLIFEGAGIRGLAYTGVLSELEHQKLMDSIQNVGGTSAGAITALMVALGYHSYEIEKIITETKFQKFNDGRFIFVSNLHRLIRKFGWYRTKKFDKWLSEIINKKTKNQDITFAELENLGYKNLYVTGTCLNKQSLLIFSNQTYPKMKIKDAVRLSMSIPLYFEAGFIDENGKLYSKNNPENSLDVVVDGGIIGNFPIFIFDTTFLNEENIPTRIENHETIGVRIDSDQQIKIDSTNYELEPQKVENLTDYFTAFYTMVIENLNRSKLTKKDWERTISVSSGGISPKIKRLSQQQKNSLIANGKASTQKYFQKK